MAKWGSGGPSRCLFHLCSYHQQARAENAFMRYKRILGDRLHARDGDTQIVEARLACNILNRMTELGMPASYAVRM